MKHGGMKVNSAFAVLLLILGEFFMVYECLKHVGIAVFNSSGIGSPSTFETGLAYFLFPI